MSHKAVVTLSITLLMVIICLHEGDTKFAIKGCLVGYKKQGSHCIFAGCPKGYRKIVRRISLAGTYHFCVKPGPKTAHRYRYGGYVSPHLIFAYVRQRITPCHRARWLRERLHRVQRRCKQAQKDIKRIKAKLVKVKGDGRKALQQILARRRKDLAKQHRIFGLLLRKVIFMERRRRMRLSMAYRKLRWWIKVAKRRIKETGAKLSKQKTKKTETKLKHWQIFLRRLKLWLRIVVKIFKRRRSRKRLVLAWRLVKRTKMAIRQVDKKIHKTKGDEQKKWIRKQSLLWALLMKRKAELRRAYKLQNATRKRNLRYFLHKVKLRIAYAGKKIGFLSKLLTKAKTKSKEAKDSRRIKIIERFISKWKLYLKHQKTLYAKLLKRHNKSQEKKKKKTSGLKNAASKAKKTNGKEDELRSLRKAMIKKKKPSTSFTFSLA